MVTDSGSSSFLSSRGKPELPDRIPKLEFGNEWLPHLASEKLVAKLQLRYEKDPQVSMNKALITKGLVDRGSKLVVVISSTATDDRSCPSADMKFPGQGKIILIDKDIAVALKFLR